MTIYIPFPLKLTLTILLVIHTSLAQAATTGEVWTGTYSCSNQQRIATVTFIDEVSAIFAFTPGKNAKPIANGSYKATVSRKGNDLLLVGTEWIQKPRGLAMVTIRLSKISDTWSGTVEHRGCGEITLTKLDDAKLDDTKLDELSSDSDDAAKFSRQNNADQKWPLYFSSVHQCANKTHGTYWALNINTNGNLSVTATIRDYSSPTSARFTEFTLNPVEITFDGIEPNGRYGVRFKLQSEGETPVIQWLDKKGIVNNKSCSHPIATVAVSPAAYWGDFFIEANQSNPEIQTIQSAAYKYKSLPHTSLLPELDRQNFKNKRNNSWKALKKSYKDNIANRLEALPVTTENERSKTRVQIDNMSNPGFKHNINFTTLYATHLFNHNIPVESLYFSDKKLACKRLQTHGKISNSVAKLEGLVGLPAIEWNRDTTQNILNTVQKCAEEDSALSKNAKIVSKAITSQMAKLTQATDKTDWLKEEADKLLSQPRNLETFVSTQGFQLNAKTLKQRQIENSTYTRHFDSKVTQARAEAAINAESELRELFAYAANAEVLQRTLRNCQYKLGEKPNRSSEWWQKLNEICIKQTQAKLTPILKTLQAEIENSGNEKSNIEKFVTTDANTPSINFATRFGLKTDVDNYLLARKRATLSAMTNYANTLEDSFHKNTPEAESKIVNACNNTKILQHLRDKCFQLTQAIVARQNFEQCNTLVLELKTPSTFAKSTLVYGEALNSSEILFSEFVCLLNKQGMNLRVDKEGSISGQDIKYNREIFSATLRPLKKNYWELSNIKVKVDDNNLKNMSSGEWVRCMINPFYC